MYCHLEIILTVFLVVLNGSYYVCEFLWVMVLLFFLAFMRLEVASTFGERPLMDPSLNPGLRSSGAQRFREKLHNRVHAGYRKTNGF